MNGPTPAIVALLSQAALRLRDAISQPKTEWTRDAAIQRFEMIEDRNRTSHIYNETIAEEIFNRLDGYGIAIMALAEQLKVAAADSD